MVAVISHVNDQKQPLLVLVGPTATGKTELSVNIARRLGAEVISADSMLIYRYMDIGTAKPTLEERRGVPHHMIDVVNPDEAYNVALYTRDVGRILEGIKKRRTLPFLVGGTGLYVKALLDGYNFSEAETDPSLRKKLISELDILGKAGLHEKLNNIDPETASRLHVNDVKRVIRALEVYYISGKTISESCGKNVVSPFDTIIYGINMDRELLYKRIEKRVDKMIGAGLVDEVRGLLEKGYSRSLVSMQGVGYKEIASYLEGEISLDQSIELLKRNTRRLAKRQLTWFRRDHRIRWVDTSRKSMEELTSEIAATVEGVFKTTSKEISRNKCQWR
ncbi:MAG: tRNA (adenosine(37)-N6)-dimethylallyltransferase MiaA [Bacillota bacterium]